MKRLWIVCACLAFAVPGLAQTLDEPVSKDDDVILYLRTMHAHDMIQRVMEVQSQNMQQFFRDQILQEKAAYHRSSTRISRKQWRLDQGHAVRRDHASDDSHLPATFHQGRHRAMNAFYSSPVGQKVLQQLPVVMQEGSKAAMPIVSRYLGEWKDRMAQEMKEMEKSAPKADPQPPQQ